MSKQMRFAALLAAVISLLALLPSCSQNKEVIATQGEYEIYYEYLRFATLNFKAEMDKVYGDGDDTNGTIWDNPESAQKYKPTLEKKVWELISDNQAVLAACASYGIGRDVMEGEAVQKAVDTSMKALRNQYTSYAAYEEAIEASFMNEDVFRFYFGIEEMKKQLLAAMLKKGEVIDDQAEFSEWLKQGNYAYVQHVARFIGENDGEEFERAIIEDVYDGLASGEHDIAYYINSRNNEDTSNTSPYFVVRGVYDDKLVDAALALEEVGDVSEIIEVEDALYILVLMEEEEGGLEKELATIFSLYQWSIVGDRVEEVKKDLKFDMTEFGKNLDLLSIK